MPIETRKEMIEFLTKFKQGLLTESDLLGDTETFEISMNLSGNYMINENIVTKEEYDVWAETNRNSKCLIVTLKI